MNKNNNLALNSRSDLLKILEFIPHSKILINLALINKFFNSTIKDFPIFTNYTLKFDCGRRGSFIGREKRGYVDNNGNLKSRKNPEVIINDKQKMILITTSNKPLRSLATKEAIIQISHTSISKIYFRSYRIPQPIENMSGLSAPSSTNSSPFQPDTISTFQNKLGQLPSIKESNAPFKNNRLYGPPPAASSGSGRNNRFICDPMSLLSLEQGQISNGSTSLTAPSPTSSINSSRLSSSINSDVVDLSFPSSASSRSTQNRISTMSVNSLSDDTQFETLLDILKTAPFASLSIGEECVSWSWKDVMLCMQYFDKIKHLAVHIGFERQYMPDIRSEQKWLDFIGMNYNNVMKLDSLWCNDDVFLRCITSLSLYRNLGENLNFIEDRQDVGYEKGSLLKNRLTAISTGTEINNNDAEGNNDTLGGHYKKKKNTTRGIKISALSYIRYRCWDAPDNELSGIEFDGAKIFELTPYDGMFITIPQSVVSFRISIGGSFYEEPDDYKIVIPLTNVLKELCVYQIDNLNKFEGLYHLKSLEYLVIRKKPKDKVLFNKYVNNLCKYAPIKQITFMFNAPKYIKNAKNLHNDYWYNLHNININENKNIIKYHWYNRKIYHQN